MARWQKHSIAIVLALFALAGCARTPPEQGLRDAMSELQSAVEKRDANALRALLADDFIGPDGLDRDGARRLAQALFLRYRDVGARIGPLDIDLQDQHARVRFDAVMTGGAGGLLPQSGRVYSVETGWRLEGGEWRLVNAGWQPGLGAAHP